MQCPVCGGGLKEHVDGCVACPLNAGCDMLCCENCGYQTVAPRSVTVDFCRRIFARLARSRRGSRAAGPARG